MYAKYKTALTSAYHTQSCVNLLYCFQGAPDVVWGSKAVWWLYMFRPCWWRWHGHPHTSPKVHQPRLQDLSGQSMSTSDSTCGSFVQAVRRWSHGSWSLGLFGKIWTLPMDIDWFGRHWNSPGSFTWTLIDLTSPGALEPSHRGGPV